MNNGRSRPAKSRTLALESLESRTVLSTVSAAVVHSGAAEVATQGVKKATTAMTLGVSARHSRPADHVQRPGPGCRHGGLAPGDGEHYRPRDR